MSELLAVHQIQIGDSQSQNMIEEEDYEDDDERNDSSMSIIQTPMQNASQNKLTSNNYLSLNPNQQGNSKLSKNSFVTNSISNLSNNQQYSRTSFNQYGRQSQNNFLQVSPTNKQSIFQSNQSGQSPVSIVNRQSIRNSLYMNEQNFVRKLSSQISADKLINFADDLKDQINNALLTQNINKRKNNTVAKFNLKQKRLASVILASDLDISEINKNRSFALFVKDQVFNEEQANQFLQQGLQLTDEIIALDSLQGDITPSEWIEKCTSQNRFFDARCPYYQNGQYIWVKSKVLSYDEEKKKFKVKLIEKDNQIKELNRLAIIFREESQKNLQSRINICKQKHKQIQDYNNFMDYVKSINDDQTQGISDALQKRIFAKCKFNINLSIDSQNKNQKERLKSSIKDGTGKTEMTETIMAFLIADVGLEYKLYEKTFIVLNQMRDPQNYPLFESKNIQLRHFYNPLPPKIGGIIKIERIVTSLNKEVLQKRDIIHKINVQKVLKKIQNKMIDLQKVPLFISNFTESVDLKEFVNLQDQYLIQRQRYFETHFREFVIGEIQDHLNDEFKFFQMDPEKFMKSKFRQLLLRINFNMENFLRFTIFQQSCQDFLQFLNDYGVMQQYKSAGDVWQSDKKIRQNGLINLELIIADGAQSKSSKSQRFNFNFIKKLNENKKYKIQIKAYPSLGQIQESFTLIIEKISNLINNFKSIQKNVVPLSDINKKHICKIEYGEKTVYQEQIQEFLEKQWVQQINPLIQQYVEFQYILTEDPQKNLDQIFNIKKRIQTRFDDWNQKQLANQDQKQNEKNNGKQNKNNKNVELHYENSDSESLDSEQYNDDENKQKSSKNNKDDNQKLGRRGSRASVMKPNIGLNLDGKIKKKQSISTQRQSVLQFSQNQQNKKRGSSFLQYKKSVTRLSQKQNRQSKILRQQQRSSTKLDIDSSQALDNQEQGGLILQSRQQRQKIKRKESKQNMTGSKKLSRKQSTQQKGFINQITHQLKKSQNDENKEIQNALNRLSISINIDQQTINKNKFEDLQITEAEQNFYDKIDLDYLKGQNYYELVLIKEDQLQQMLDNMQNDKLKVQKSNINIVKTVFFQVNTTKVKQYIIDQLDQNVSTVLDTLNQYICSNLDRLEEDIVKLHEKLILIPKDEEQLVELKQIIQNSQNDKKIIDDQISKIKSLKDILNSKFIDLSEIYEEKYWLLYKWPNNLQKNYQDAKKIFESMEKQFMDTIVQETNNFISKIGAIQREFDITKSFHNFNNAKDYNYQAVILNEKLIDLVNIALQYNKRETLLGLKITKHKKLQDIQQKSKAFIKFWEIAFQFQNDKLEYTTGQVLNLKYPILQAKMETYTKEILLLQREFTEQVEGKQTLKALLQMKKELENLQDKLWIIELLTLESMTKKTFFYKEIFIECQTNGCSLNLTTVQTITETIEIMENDKDKDINEILEEQKQIKMQQQETQVKKKESQNGTQLDLLNNSNYLNTSNINNVSQNKNVNNSEIQQQSYPVQGSKQIKIPNIEELSLLQLLEMGLNSYRHIIEEVSRKAEKQYSIEKKLSECIEKSKEIRLEIQEYKNTKIKIMKNSEEVQDQFSDILAIVIMMKNQPWIKPIYKKAHEFENRISVLADLLEELQICQKGWIYLEAIFQSVDIQDKMAKENKQFQLIDKIWKNTMHLISENPFIYDIDQERIRIEIQNAIKNIVQVQKALVEYLESKRQIFPRFYFNSDEDLFDMLSKCRDPVSFIIYMSKCFEGIKSIELNNLEDTNNILYCGMVSEANELVLFNQPIKAKNDSGVENWMLNIEKQMRISLKTQLKLALKNQKDSQYTFDKWVLQWPSQIVVLIESIYTVNQIEKAILQNQLDKQSNLINLHLKKIIRIIREKKDLDDVERGTLTQLIIQGVHYKDILEELHTHKCNSIDDFMWQKCQRFSLEFEQKEVVIQNQPIDITIKMHMLSHQIIYNFEYLGNTSRLVLTPLTDRCYRTLLTAYKFYFGGAPEGPAGTGKTETVKDLAKSCGMNCVVFNASEGINYLAMAKFFKGLASSGSWCCFDEFNRINPEVLSVVSQQVLQILSALKNQKLKFFFDGQECNIINTCTFNITMNPGYSGRTELPDNLKNLLRPVSMMIADFQMIAEIFLFSNGFYNSRDLSQKIVYLMKLSQEQLSHQDHYDFGMRTLKAILQACTLYIHKFQDLEESQIVIKALKVINYPKFTQQDGKLFLQILKDMFKNGNQNQVKDSQSDLDSDDENIEEITQELEISTVEMGINGNKIFYDKCIQLYKSISIRHGIIIVGPAGVGKSTIVSLLIHSIDNLTSEIQESEEDEFQEEEEEEDEEDEDNQEDKIQNQQQIDQEIQYRKIFPSFINPKSISYGQLNGIYDDVQKIWIDGILVQAIREYQQQNFQKGEMADEGWIIFDGPVDPVWIENMNTVLDDNKKLCLPSGEIIKLTNFQKTIFETQDLTHASPATISRCGMVYLQENIFDWRLIVDSFFYKDMVKDIFYLREEIVEYYTVLLNFFVDVTYTFIKNECNMRIQFSKFTLTQQFMDFIAAIFKEMFEEDIEKGQFSSKISGIKTKSRVVMDNILRKEDVINNIIIFSLIWSFGGLLDEKDKQKFNIFFTNLFQNNQINQEYDYDYGPYNNVQIYLKKSGNIIHALQQQKSCFNIKLVQGKWQTWNDKSIQQQNKRSTFFNMQLDTVQVDNQTQNENENFQQQNDFNLIVMTKETQKLIFFTRFNILNKSRHFLIMGNTGTGKTLIIQNEMIQTFQNKDCTGLSLCLSGNTKVSNLQKNLESKMTVRRKKGVFSPEDKKQKLVVFIDDINLPQKDQYDSQPPLELIRQQLDMEGWYSTEDRQFQQMQGIVFIGAMIPKKLPSLRLLRHFFPLYLDNYSQESLLTIFNQIAWERQNKQQYNLEVQQIQKDLIQGIITLFYQIKKNENLMQTPKKQHYLVNLRDIHKVCNGICLSDSELIINQLDMVRLWMHECSRVFKDRLVNSYDQQVFDKLIKSVMKKIFVNVQNITNLAQSDLSQCFYNQFYEPIKDKKGQIKYQYKQIINFGKFKQFLESKLEEYNINNPKQALNIIFFEDALLNVLKIQRILQFKQGNSLLIGNGSIGRSILTQISCFIDNIQIQFYQSGQDWREQIKRMYEISGCEDQVVCFYINDNQINQDQVLEDVNLILNQGFIPELFNSEEKLKLVELMEENKQAQEKKLNPEKFVNTNNRKKINQEPLVNRFQKFLSESLKNLRIFISFNPNNKKYSERIRTYSSLVNCTNIVWFQDWVNQSYQNVAYQMIFNENLENSTIETLVLICTQNLQNFQNLCEQYKQETSKKVWITPQIFIRQLKLFNTFKDKFQQENTEMIERYDQGVLKIDQTETEVGKMRVNLEAMKIELETLSQQNAVIIESIDVNSKEVEKKTQICEKESAQCKIQKDTSEKLQNECQEELDKVLPILEEASDALKNIKKDDLTKIKSYANPSDCIKLVMEGLCYALGIDQNVKEKPIAPGSNEKHQDFWDYSKKFLLNDKLTKLIKKYTPEQITQLEKSKIQKLEILIKNPLFDKERIFQASTAAGNLSSWIRAVYDVFNAMQVVEPKQKKLEESQIQFDKAQKLLEQKKIELEQVVGTLKKLQADFLLAASKKEEITSKFHSVKKQLNIAEKLIQGLAIEKESWKEKGIECKEKGKTLIGDSLIVSILVAFQGPFEMKYRQQIIKQLHELLEQYQITYKKELSLDKMLSNPVDTGMWTNKYKLPNDQLFIDNVVMKNSCQEFCICIDPQQQANYFFKEMESDNSLLVINSSSQISDIQVKLEQSITQGYPILLEDLGNQISPSYLEPLILQNFILKKNEYKYGFQVKLGNKIIDGSGELNLYITTKNNNLQFSSQIFSKCNIINFSITEEGLYLQLINVIVGLEEPQKEQQRIKNITKIYELSVQSDTTEKKILQLINAFQGDDILKDDVLVETLQSSKQQTIEIKEKTEKIQVDLANLNQIIQYYSPAVQLISSLFFIFVDIQKLDNMYSFSLEWFKQVIENCINNTPVAKGKPERKQSIIDTFKWEIYINTCKSIKDDHKLLFSLLLCFKMMILQEKLYLQDIKFFSTQFENKSDFESTYPFKQQQEGILNLQQWNKFNNIFDTIQKNSQYNYLDSIFPQKMVQQMVNNINKYQVYFQDQYECIKFVEGNQKLKLPDQEYQQLSSFYRLILVKQISPNFLVQCIQKFLNINLGKEFTTVPKLDLQQTFQQTSKSIPIMFITDSGIDVFKQVNVISEKLRTSLLSISLGQGQLQKAEHMIFQAMKIGQWILIENCHLVSSFIPILENILDILETYSPGQIKKEFKLILSTHATDIFPLKILHKVVKIRLEQPHGIKQILQDSYQIVQQDKQLQNLHQQSDKFQRLFFNIAFFHSIVQERKKFGSFGWNSKYQFNLQDLNFSLLQVQEFLNALDQGEKKVQQQFPVNQLHFIICESIYGGRIVDKHDSQLLQLILKQYLNEDMFRQSFQINQEENYKVPFYTKDRFWVNHLEVIKEYPNNDNAEVFGLHPNSSIKKDKQVSEQFLKQLFSLMPNTVVQQKNNNQKNQKKDNKIISNESILKQKLIDIQQIINNKLQIDEQKIPQSQNSLNTFLIMEISKYNVLLQFLQDSISNLLKTIEGTEPQTQESEQMCELILINQIPKKWKSLSFITSKLLSSWVKDIQIRTQFYQLWIEQNQIPEVFSIGALFSIQSFFTSLQQNFSRQKNINISHTSFKFDIKDYDFNIQQQNNEEIILQGFFLEGASWNNQLQILEDLKFGEIITKMPYFSVKIIEIKQFKDRQTEEQEENYQFYNCPFYSNGMRQNPGNGESIIKNNYIMDINLRCIANQNNNIQNYQEIKDKWFLRGVALLAQSED